MGLWTYYKSLAPSTRFMVGSGVIVWSYVGMKMSETLEKAWNLTPNEEQKKHVESYLPVIKTADKGKWSWGN